MSVPWIAWNLFLAIVPLALSIPLFQRNREPRGWQWWLGLTAFVAFLPNAPYVLTDVIHFTREVRGTPSDFEVAFVLIPKYSTLFAVGFGSYVVSLVRLEHWLRNRGWSFRRVLGLDVGIHALCAVGIFLGRVFRLNSWDLLARPVDVLSVIRVPKAASVAVLTLTFLVLAGGTAGLRIAGHIRDALNRPQ